MPFLPQDPFAIAGLVLILVGVGIVVARRDVPKAYGFGLLIMLVFALDTLARFSGHLRGPHPLGFRAADLIGRGEWWTPITSVFVHAGPGHLVGNLFILVTAGPALEDKIGGRRFVAIFFVAALAALVAQLVMAYVTDITNPFATAVGASGGIFGILTAYAVRYPKDRLPIPLFFIIWIPAFYVLLLFLLFNIGYALSDTNVAWWGHFAGFLVGLPAAYSLPEGAAQPGSKGSARGLPDAEKLAPLATTADLKRIHDRLRQFTPETRTHDDTTYADAWLSQFFEKARCPTCGEALLRRGMSATCTTGDYRVDFARKK